MRSFIFRWNPICSFIVQNCSTQAGNQHLKYVSSHIAKILACPKSKQKFEGWENYFLEIKNRNQAEQTIKNKCNMIFHILTAPQIISQWRQLLCSLVVDDHISHQGQLDCIQNWIKKMVKTNPSLSSLNIKQFISSQLEQQASFIKEIKILKLGQQKMADICKMYRQKYPSVQGKFIYDQLCLYHQTQQNHTLKTNMFWDKINAIKPRHILEELNDQKTLDHHFQQTKGKLRFRFPPEPNGCLHIGHVKSIRINFETAKRNGGECFLRYDDTNPETEKSQYVKEIQENIKWLGYVPDRITFASDYFQEMLFFANELIKKGFAYVCDCSQQVIEQQRRLKQPNPCRNRTIQESLKMFPNLGSHQTLRLKGDLKAANPTLRDPVIYRVKQNSCHPKTGKRYRIYPIYDFAHCISDSLQHIDYSLCSLEFEVRRDLYYRYLHLLGIFKPTVWEYSRLNLQKNVLSKRKIKELISQGVIDSWADPRLATLRGLRARGYTANMLIQFIDKVNSSRHGNQKFVQYSLLQRVMKKHLIQQAPRTMAVLQPIHAIIQNEGISLYIERSDFQNLCNQELFFLKSKGLMKVVSKGDNEIKFRAQAEEMRQKMKDSSRIKALHWISQNEAIPYQVTIYSPLLGDDGSLVPTSKQLFTQALIKKEVLEQKTKGCNYWQFQRIGFFTFMGENLICCVKL